MSKTETSLIRQATESARLQVWFGYGSRPRAAAAKLVAAGLAVYIGNSVIRFVVSRESLAFLLRQVEAE